MGLAGRANAGVVNSSGFTPGIFSEKQLDFICNSDARLNVACGSVRSGKTVASLVRWIEFCKRAPDGYLLMFGKTERTLKRNVLDPLLDMVGPKRFHYNKGNGEGVLCGRKLYIAGANDERSEGKIRGITLAGAYGDELALCGEAFFKMLLSRLSVRGSMLIGTTNPDNPYHWLKTDYLDKVGLNLKKWSFILEDNVNLDPEYVRNLKLEYSGLWYKRFIQGLWCLAEGAIYDMFDESKHVINYDPVCDYYWITCDYGISTVATFLLQGRIGDKYFTLDEYYFDAKKEGYQKAPEELIGDLIGFMGTKRIPVYCDPSATGFINSIRREGYIVYRSNNDVLQGIQCVSNKFHTGKYFIHKRCYNTIKEKGSYVWDAKAQKIGEDKPLKQNDHCSDAERYGIFTVSGNSDVMEIGSGIEEMNTETTSRFRM